MLKHKHTIETIKNLILNNWGIGFLPQFTIKASENLCVIKYKTQNPFYIQLLYYPELQDNTKYRDFVEIVHESLNSKHV